MRSAPLGLLFLLLSFFVQAQPNTAPGYIVKNNGDTIHGSLKLVRDKELMYQISFKGNDKENFRTYRPNELRSYEYDDGDLFRAVSFDNTSGPRRVHETLFVRAVVLGIYELYAFSEDNQSFFIVRSDTAVYFMSDSRVDGYNVIPGTYRSVLNFLSAGCDSLNRYVERTSFLEDNLADFIRGLNHCASPGSSVVRYQHKVVKDTHFLVYAGGLPGMKRTQFTAEAVLRFVYPRFNPKASVNIGFHYSNTVSPSLAIDSFGNTYKANAIHTVISIPVTLQYNFTSWIIQPYAYGGVSLAYVTQMNVDAVTSHYFGPAIVAGGGIEIHPCKGLILKVDYRDELFSQYPSFGLSFMF